MSILKPKLTKFEKCVKWHNMMRRCYNEKWQDENGKKYRVCSVSNEWLNDRKKFYNWLDKNWYVIPDKQMDLDHDILLHGNTVYGRDTLLVVPHYINAFFETITPGKTNITYNAKRDRYRVRIIDNITDVFEDEVFDEEYDSYKEALDAFFTVKQMILFAMTEKIKRQIPKKVYNALISVDIKERNKEIYEEAGLCI